MDGQAHHIGTSVAPGASDDVQSGGTTPNAACANGWSLAGRTVALTGATGGIAGAIIDAVAGEDVTIVLHARRETSLDGVADDLAKRGTDVRCISGDLADEAEDIAQMIAEAGPVDVLINAAGIYSSGDLLSTDIDTICEDFDVNAIAAIAIMQAVLPGMNERGYGRIVNISSGGGSFGEGLDPSHAAYAISKAALNAATVLGARSARGNVKVNAVCPGWVRTRMGGGAAPRSPAEGADTAIWLATLDEDGPTGGFFRDRKPIPW